MLVEHDPADPRYRHLTKPRHLPGTSAPWWWRRVGAIELAWAPRSNYHRLPIDGGWRTPADRFDGTPSPTVDSGSSPTVAAIADLLDAMVGA